MFAAMFLMLLVCCNSQDHRNPGADSNLDCFVGLDVGMVAADMQAMPRTVGPDHGQSSAASWLGFFLPALTPQDTLCPLIAARES